VKDETAVTLCREQWSATLQTLGHELVERLRLDSSAQLIPVVNDNLEPVGLLERSAVLGLVSSPLRYAVFENRSVEKLLTEGFKVFDIHESLDQIAHEMLGSGREDVASGGFVLTEGGRYVGVGLNGDLLNYLLRVSTERAQIVQNINAALLESVNYASRIQRSLLPTDHALASGLHNVGALWQPRDVVGGDFYWRSPGDGQRFTLGLIDCTGHGVPGALMAMLVNALLNRVFAQEPQIGPGHALQWVDHLVRSTLNQDQQDALSNDGFDAALVCIDNGERQLVFAGARVDLYVIPTSPEQPVGRLQSRRRALGFQEQQQASLEEHVLDLDSIGCAVLASDGVFDQPGGSKARALGARRWMEMLQTYRHLSAEQLMKEALINLELWRGQQVRRDDLSALAFSPQRVSL
jgi:phosphoserine phosphatase RsbU/P